MYDSLNLLLHGYPLTNFWLTNDLELNEASYGSAGLECMVGINILGNPSASAPSCDDLCVIRGYKGLFLLMPVAFLCSKSG